MGLLTSLVTLPLAPVRGTTWLAERVLEEAERRYYDPGAIRRQLEEISAAREAGAISDEDARAAEKELVARLIESRRHPRREA
ncbi:gas vesicle protein [Microbacterium mangrovi]|uniref:Gas vesicle protein n=1 Tax=Microbacterium mangrovi TaxID=1348253 RepID=A0A0B2A4K2_9MICO|nr:gas vesicle protein GvpG [Microbacterium mangrovi]KHK96532.1 gas vesicle protein [Microbacterium mangrovi]